MDYWKEIIAEALCEEGLQATDEQISNIAYTVKLSAEMQPEATGLSAATRGQKSEHELELIDLKKQLEKQDRWLRDSEPCHRCATTGTIFDGWVREKPCPSCGGKGRVDRKYY